MLNIKTITKELNIFTMILKLHIGIIGNIIHRQKQIIQKDVYLHF